MLSIKKIFIIFISFTLNVQAAENSKPLFEFGVFIGAVSLPDYPASDQSRQRTLPIPLIRYHGDFFRSDEDDGSRFRFINNKNFDLDLSFGGSFATETNNNRARFNMPNLDWTAEIGPRLLYYLMRDKQNLQIRVGVPYRASFATDFKKWYGVGNVFAPVLQLDKYNFLIENLDLYSSHTISYLDEGHADYFYQVDTPYANAERPAYDASAGLLGSETSLALKYKWANKTIILATRYSDYTQSANTQSHLHRNNINWSFFLGFSWIFAESEARAENQNGFD